MLFFFLGRFRISNSYSIIQYGLLVYIVVGIAALYLFFAMPSWYYDFKVNGWWNIIDTGQINLEMIRLSAFWKYPYWIVRPSLYTPEDTDTFSLESSESASISGASGLYLCIDNVQSYGSDASGWGYPSSSHSYHAYSLDTDTITSNAFPQQVTL